MNREDFGELIRALRKEHEDENGEFWTQEKLAQEATSFLAAGSKPFTAEIISNIECGKKKHLDQQTLLALADALQLTSGERKEFFLAASGVDSENFARQDYDPGDVLSELIDRMKEVYLPAYIIDSYCDVIACNAAVVKLLDLESAGLRLETQEKKRFGLNMLQFVFSKKAVDYYESLMGRYWREYAYQNMMIFRTFTLRYRSTEYFKALLRELKRHRHFMKYWRSVYYEEKNHFVDNEHIYLKSPQWGPLVYFSTSITAVTTAGELHFCVYVPATQGTASVFTQIVKDDGPEIRCLVDSWPEKVIPSRTS